VSDTPVPVSRTLAGAGVILHALDWNPNGSLPLLLCHGWLDHAHSFDWLCAELPASWRKVAIDFRGHGESSHLLPGASHGYADYLADIEAALDGLGWSSVHLAGHSLGGSACIGYAAARPERVRSLTLIESLGPSGGPPELAVGRLTQFLNDLKKPRHKRAYPSVEEVAARIRENNSGLSEAVALHLARFGVRKTSEGFKFTFDPALRRHSGLILDEDQLLAVMGAVQCPVQVIHGSGGFSFEDEQMQRRLQKLRSPPTVRLEGGHHIHLDQPAEVAAHLLRFITALEGGAGKA
jgi:pimeloyl-ACP methyl ester carboxylesterase